MESLVHTLGSLDAWIVYGLLALLVFGESAALLAVLFPGELALMAAGVFVARGQVELSLVLAIAFVAAVAGQAVGYELGRRYGLQVFETRPLRRYARAVDRVSHAVARHGALAVFVGRWTNLGRILVPLLVGAGRMPYRAFAVYNVLGGLAWVVAFVLLGTFAGASLGAVERVASQIGWSMTGVVTAAVVVAWGLRYGHRRRRGRPPTAEAVSAAMGVAVPSSSRCGA